MEWNALEFIKQCQEGKIQIKQSQRKMFKDQELEKNAPSSKDMF